MKSEWKIRTVGELTSYISKGIPPKYTDKKTNSTIVVLNQKCNRDYKISYEQSRLHDTTKKAVPTDKMLQYGDVLINSTGTGTAGRIAQFFNNDISTTVDGHMIIMRASKEIDYLYYGYALKSYQKKIESFAEGSTGQTEINKQRLQEELLIKHPQNIDLQRSIALILKNIDDKIELNTAINENLEQQAQALYRQMFVYADDNQSATIADISLNVTDGVHNTVKDDPDGSYLLLSCKNIKGGSLNIGSGERHINKETFDKLRKRTQLAKGDILISSVGTIGEILMLNTEPTYYEFQRSVAMIKPDTELVSPAYVYESLLYKKAELINAAHGAVQQCLFISDISEFPIDIPSKVKLDIFNSAVIPMFEIITANNEENQRLAALRDTLLPKLMNGEIDVSAVKI